MRTSDIRDLDDKQLGEHIATTTARVTDVPAGETVPVQFTSADAWKPGQKVLLLQVG